MRLTAVDVRFFAALHDGRRSHNHLIAEEGCERAVLAGLLIQVRQYRGPLLLFLQSQRRFFELQRLVVVQFQFSSPRVWQTDFVAMFLCRFRMR